MLAFNITLTVRRYEAAVALAILILSGSALFSLPGKEVPLPAPASPYRIALTFDDGPHPYFTDTLVALLREENVPATFFIVGRQAAKYPSLVRYLVMQGHDVEGHTFTHPNLARLGDGEIRKELTATRNLIRELAGRESTYFRPPGGRYDEEVVRVAGELGMSMVLWSVFPKDHEEDDPEIIVRRCLDQATDGGVILLHSGIRATCAALPRIIRELKARGYRFVTVGELARSRPAGELAWLHGK